MIFNSDSFYEIGSGHIFCEDYAVHGALEDYRWGIISDGCSGSKYTDVGARLISRKADSVIRDFISRKLEDKLELDRREFPQSFIDSVMLDINGIGCISMAKELSLPDCSLDATLWIVIRREYNHGSYFSVIGWGDGEVVIKGKDSIEIFYVQYPSGAPFYPIYRFDDNKEKYYVSNWGTSCKHGHIFKKNEGLLLQEENEDLYCSAFNLYCPHALYSDVQSVTIMTDGFRTYNTGDCLQWAASRLIDFKSYEGVFLQRRMRALARRDVKENIGHSDDIAAASVLLMEEPVEIPDGKI